MLIAPFHRLGCHGFVGLAFVLATSNTLASEADRVEENVRLTIAPEYYVVGSARFKNVASVQAWLVYKRSRVEAIDDCASTAEPKLLAVVELLYPPPGRALELRSLPPAAADCTRDWSASNGDGDREFLREEDYFVTDEVGRSLIP